MHTIIFRESNVLLNDYYFDVSGNFIAPAAGGSPVMRQLLGRLRKTYVKKGFSHPIYPCSCSYTHTVGQNPAGYSNTMIMVPEFLRIFKIKDLS